MPRRFFASSLDQEPKSKLREDAAEFKPGVWPEATMGLEQDCKLEFCSILL